MLNPAYNYRHLTSFSCHLFGMGEVGMNRLLFRSIRTVTCIAQEILLLFHQTLTLGQPNRQHNPESHGRA